MVSTPRRYSVAFSPDVIAEIERAADQGLYRIRGFGSLRPLPSFDDLVLLGASMSRYPLEGYRERCATDVTLGTRFAKKPIELKIPITIAGMSFGALGVNAKRALGRGASAVGTSTTTGDGGMSEEERAESDILVYQVLPSRYGFDPAHLRVCEAIEIVVGQGTKPGGGGMLLGQKITELREATDWEKPVFVKIGSARPRYDVQLAVKAGADVVVLDGMQGGTGATQEVFIEHAGIPTLPALRQAVEALEELGMHREVQLVISGGIRTGADVAKALAMGADAVSIGTAALVALGCNRAVHIEDYAALGTEPGACHHCHTGRCPVGITTHDPALESQLDVAEGARRVRNFLTVLTMEAQTLARACGKSHLHNLEPEDLAALTVEAAAMAGVPLAGTDWIPGRNG